MSKKALPLALLLTLMPAFAHAAYVYPVAGNAMRDNNNDGVADELTPYSANYVFKSPSTMSESRTFAELDISALGAFTSASLQFMAFRYNEQDTQLAVYGYQGNGVIQLSDWNAGGTLLAVTPVIQGYADWSQRGEGINFSYDITASLQAAKAAGSHYYSIYFTKPVAQDDALVTVGNYSIITPSIAAPVPDSSSTLVLAAIATTAALALRRRRRG